MSDPVECPNPECLDVLTDELVDELRQEKVGICPRCGTLMRMAPLGENDPKERAERWERPTEAPHVDSP